MDKFCPECGSPLDPESGKCPQCVPKVYPNFCSLCGSPVDPLTGLCVGCGAQACPVAEPSPTAKTDEISADSPSETAELSSEEKEEPDSEDTLSVESDDVLSQADETPLSRFCPVCGSAVDQKERRCIVCGLSAAEMPVDASISSVIVSSESDAAEAFPEGSSDRPHFCERCGTAVHPADEVCPNCGASILPLRTSETVLPTETEVDSTVSPSEDGPIVAATSICGEDAEVRAPNSVKKKNFAVTVLISVVASLFLFVFGVFCLGALTLRLGISPNGVETALESVKVSDLIHIAFDPEEELYHSTVSYLEEKYGISVTSDRLDRIADRISVKPMLAEKIASFGQDLISFDDTFSVTKKEIVSVLKEAENRSVLEEELGVSLSDESLDEIASRLIRNGGFDLVSVSSLREELPLQSVFASFFLSYPAVVIFAIFASLFAFLMLRRDLSFGVLATGINLIVISSLFGLSFLVLKLISLFSAGKTMTLLSALGSGVLQNCAVVYAVLFGIGVVALAVRGIVLSVRKRPHS